MIKKRIFTAALGLFRLFGGNIAAKKFDTRLRYGRKLNLKNPESLSEKVTYLELVECAPLTSVCTDKYEVREYVKSKGLGHILIPLLGGPWSSAEEVDFDSLPDSFVIKATHGCVMNYIVPDKLKFDPDNCKKTIGKWLNTTYGIKSIEPHYSSIPHRLYAEKFLENADELIDYKFHCMNGKAQFVLTCSERHFDDMGHMKVTLDLFDMNWNNLQEIADPEEAGDGTINKPEKFEEMVRIAELLASDFKFVRVDLYEMDGSIYFGELTFTPASGVFPSFSEKFDREMGRKLVI